MIADKMKLVIGIALFLLVGIMFYPAITSSIQDTQNYGEIEGYVALTANTPSVLFYNPVHTFLGLLRVNVSSASNVVPDNMDASLTKSLATTTPYSLGYANLTIECNHTGSEELAISFGINDLGMIDDACPYTFTNVSQSWIGDPASTITITNEGTDFLEYKANSSTRLINDTLYEYVYTTNHAKAKPVTDMAINITFSNPEGDIIQVSFNGFNYANATGNSIYTTGMPVGLLASNGSQTFKFLDLNGTNFDGDNVTAINMSFTYTETVSNFTSATLSYRALRSYPSANYTVTSTTISANHSGTYWVNYIYGSDVTQMNGTILAIIPVIFIGFLIFMAYISFKR